MDDSFAINFTPDDPRGLGFLSRGPLIAPPEIHVYLAGPMTNNDEETKEECQAVRNTVKELLHGYDYLGVRFYVYDPADVTPPGTDHSPEDVFVTDYGSTVGAELVVFHVNVPSLGVGMEAQISAYGTIPRVIISKRGSPVSRMFRGTFAPTVAQIEYDTAADVRRNLTDEITIIAAASIESAEKRRPIAQELAELRLGKRVLKQRILKRMTIEQLARETDIREFWLVRLEKDPFAFSTASLVQFLRICHALDCHASISTEFKLTFSSAAENELDSDQEESLNNLADFAQSRTEIPADDKLFRLWGDYIEQQREQAAEAGQFRSTGGSSVVPVEEWGRRYNSLGLF